MDDLDNLLKTDNNISISKEKSSNYENMKHSISQICKTLLVEPKDYKLQKTIEYINDYNKKWGRILYSEINRYIFEDNKSEGNGGFVTNITKLMEYVLNDKSENITDECRKMVVKIYDHSQLVMIQTNKVRNVFKTGIEDAKINFQKEIKGIEKNYISILGIFAAIVLAFVGGITFSSSVLQNINSVSIYRLLLVVTLLALILINVIWLLVKFIADINEKEINFFNRKCFNWICVIFVLLVCIAWLFDLTAFGNYLHSILPWK